MRRILIIQGHPDAAGRHLCHALAEAYANEARTAGHEVSIVDIATLTFPLLRTQEEFEKGPIPVALVPVRDELLAAQHIVLVFPLWLGTMPALMKAFLEQLIRPGIAFAPAERGFPRGLLAGRSARVVVTMGMPVFAYRWWFRAHGIRGLERSILRFAGISPVRESLFGNIGAAGEATRRRWLRRMRALGARAA